MAFACDSATMGSIEGQERESECMKDEGDGVVTGGMLIFGG